MNDDIVVLLLIFPISYLFNVLFKKFVLPKLIEIDTKEIKKNPSWIMKDVEKNYYGFSDIDIILADTNVFTVLPTFRFGKTGRFELLIPNETSTKDVDEVLRLALIGKIKMKYGLFYTDKPIYWLSILCYMLDGGDIEESTTKFKEKQETS